MKKLALALIAVVMIFSFAACKDKGDLGAQTTANEQGVVEYNTVSTFDYSDFAKENADKAVTDGFKVTEGRGCLDKKAAKNIAAKEFSGDFSYTSLKLSYDRSEGIWRVSYFSDTNAEHICIDETGKTVLTLKETFYESNSNSNG